MVYFDISTIFWSGSHLMYAESTKSQILKGAQKKIRELKKNFQNIENLSWKFGHFWTIFFFCYEKSGKEFCDLDSDANQSQDLDASFALALNTVLSMYDK